MNSSVYNNNFNEIDIDILREFIDGDVHDIYMFVKKCYYRDMYMTVYKYCFKQFDKEDPIEMFIKNTLFTYKLQNHLNQSMKVTDGKYFDDYLMRRVIEEVFRKFEGCPALRGETHQTFLNRIIEIRKNSISTELSSKQDLTILNSLIKDRFSNQETVRVEDVINYINDLMPEDIKEETKINFFEYLNNLITMKKVTLNQLGSESLIKKGIYDISLGKIPTKNQLICISIALRLSKDESEKLFDYARIEVKNTSYSNIYSFEKDNNRDILILHWMNNITQLEEIADKKHKNIIQLINDILRDSKYEELS